jgi:pyruvate formate lyase activating enzyme
MAAGTAYVLGARNESHAGWLDKLFEGNPEKKVIQNDAPKNLWKWSKEAYHYIDLGENLECKLCPNECKMEPESRSKCKVRVHKNGKLYTLVYGNPAAVHVDPIEKKPLYHFYPGTGVFSLGFAGCNLQCLNCQNWELSQKKPEELKRISLFPEEAVMTTIQSRCKSIAYTYNEPSVVYEFMLDTSKLAGGSNVKNVWVTNGYINREPLLEFCKYLDAANVDLKSYSEEIYKKLNYGKLQPVLDTLQLLKEKGIWFELTTLIVPTYTDDMIMIREMCKWISKNLGPDVPLHFSRFGPQYKLEQLPSTPPSKLIEARKIAMEEGIRYVYIGNYRTPDGSGSNTYCPDCKETVIERIGYLVTKNTLKTGKCGNCDFPIAGRW